MSVVVLKIISQAIIIALELRQPRGLTTPHSTSIEELNRRGFFSVDEVARKIVQDEMALGGDALPGNNIGQRIEKMIVRSIETTKMLLNSGMNR